MQLSRLLWPALYARTAVTLRVNRTATKLVGVRGHFGVRHGVRFLLAACAVACAGFLCTLERKTWLATDSASTKREGRT